MTPSAVIEQRGWKQGDGDGPNGEVCMGRAICLAYHPGVEICGTLDDCGWTPFTNALPMLPLTSWNDAPGRTQEEVLTFLKSVEVLLMRRSQVEAWLMTQDTNAREAVQMILDKIDELERTVTALSARLCQLEGDKK